MLSIQFNIKGILCELVELLNSRMARIVLHVLCAILLAASTQGCGFLNIKCKIKQFIEEESSKLIGQAEQAFEQAMDYVFDQDIIPLLDKAEAAIDAGIDKVDKDVNETINHIESSIETIIHDAAETANSLASNLTHDIEEIISKAASAMVQVEKTFYRDASHLLDQINQIVQKGQCMEAGGARQIQDGIYRLLKALNPYYRLSRCWRSMGYKVTMTLEDLTDIQLYNYQKQCTLLNKITPNTPIEGPGGILQTYAQGQLYAAEYYCIGETANAPAFQDVLSKEWLWWGVQYNTWRNIGMTTKNNTVEPDGGKTVKQLKDSPCGTPVECYAQAIKALNEAEQKILSLQTGLLNLNHTVIANQIQVLANQEQVNATILGLEANVSANGQAISTNADAIVANENSITTNEDDITQQLSSLQAYPCNCEDMSPWEICSSDSFSQGYTYYCKASSCKDSWSPVMGTTTGTGILCCELCMGTAEEAEAYAHANPSPQAVYKECKTLEPKGLQQSIL